MFHNNAYVVMVILSKKGNRVITVIESDKDIGFPGGRNDKPGETSKDAAMREFREETGADYKLFRITSERQIIHKHRDGSTTLGILAVCTQSVEINMSHRFIEYKHGKPRVETLGVMLPRVSEICDALQWNHGKFHCNFTNDHVNEPVNPVSNSIQWTLRRCIARYPHPELVAFLNEYR